MTKTEVKNFRSDFEKAIVQLQEQYGVSISTGTIRFTEDELRFKVTAKKGKVIAKLNKRDLVVGDIVSINHRRVPSNKRFEVIKIMTKNIKVQEVDGIQQFTVSPGLLQKR